MDKVEGYTPTTGRIRDAYTRAMRNAFIASAGEHDAEFDRWLLSEWERIWDEGFDRGYDLMVVESAQKPHAPDLRRNPYRKGGNA